MLGTLRYQITRSTNARRGEGDRIRSKQSRSMRDKEVKIELHVTLYSRSKRLTKAKEGKTRHGIHQLYKKKKNSIVDAEENKCKIKKKKQ